MKRFLIAASCFSLIVPALAEAQYNQPQNGKPEHPSKPEKPAGGPQGGGNYRPSGGGGGQPNYRPSGGGSGQPNYRPSGGGTGQPNYRPNPNYGGPNRPGNPSGGGNNQPNYRPGPHYNGGGGRPNYRPGYRGSGRYGAWNGQRFRGSRWSWPRGYGYQRWWIGGILPAIFLSQAYWFDDYSDLGFGPPPYGCEWVRYGPDLLLVDIDSGQIVDVEYGVFD